MSNGEKKSMWEEYCEGYDVSIIISSHLSPRLLANEYDVSGGVVQGDIRYEKTSSSQTLQPIEKRRADEQYWIRLRTVDHLTLQLQPLK